MPQGLLEQAQFTWANFLLEIWEAGEWELQPEEDRTYGQQHLVEHLDEAGMPDDVLYGLISNDWRDAWSAIDPTYTGYLNDVDRIWQRAEATQELAIQVKCALCRATAVTFSTTLPADLLYWALVTGQLDAQQVLYLIQRKPNEDERAAALKELIPDLPQNALPAALEMARSISIHYGTTRADVLESLIPRLPGTMQNEALAVGRTIEQPSLRAQALTALIPHQPNELRDELATETLEVVKTIYYQADRARELVRLAPHLPEALLPEAIAVARAIKGDESRVRALTGLLPYLSGELQTAVLAETISMARVIEPEEVHAVSNLALQARALAELTPYLEGPAREDLAAEVLAIVRSMRDLYRGAEVLEVLAPYLSPELLAEAFQIACAFAEWARPAAFEKLAPYLSHETAAAARASAKAIKDKYDRQRALQALAPYFPGIADDAAVQAAQSATVHDQLAVAATAGETATLIQDEPPLSPLEEARQIEDAHRRVRELTWLLPQLDEAERKSVTLEALHAARQIKDAQDRAEALSTLIPEFNEDERTAIVAEALAAAQTIDDDDIQSRLLDELTRAVPIDEVVADIHAYYGLLVYDDDEVGADWAQAETGWSGAEEGTASEPLPDELLAERLEAARTAKEGWQKATILAELAPHLSTERQLEAVALIDAIADDDDRMRALAELAPFLPEARLSQALEREQLVNSQRGLSETSRALLPFLPPDVLAQTWEAIKSIEHEDGRRLALLDLLPRVLDDKIDEAMEIGFSIGDYDESAEAMIGLAPHVPDDSLESVVSEALDAIQQADNEDDYPEPFLRILPFVPEHMLAKALEVAGTLFVQDEPWRRAMAFQGMGNVLLEWVVRRPEEAYAGWRAALRRAADNPRPTFLRDLTGLHYFALILAGENEAAVREEMRQAIEEVCAW